MAADAVCCPKRPAAQAGRPATRQRRLPAPCLGRGQPVPRGHTAARHLPPLPRATPPLAPHGATCCLTPVPRRGWRGQPRPRAAAAAGLQMVRRSSEHLLDLAAWRRLPGHWLRPCGSGPVTGAQACAGTCEQYACMHVSVAGRHRGRQHMVPAVEHGAAGGWLGRDGHVRKTAPLHALRVHTRCTVHDVSITLGKVAESVRGLLRAAGTSSGCAWPDPPPWKQARCRVGGASGRECVRGRATWRLLSAAGVILARGCDARLQPMALKPHRSAPWVSWP